MIHKDLQFHLEGLERLGITEDRLEYIKLKTFLEELSKYPKKDWGKEEVVDEVKAVVNNE